MTDHRRVPLRRNVIGVAIIVAALAVIGVTQWWPHWSAYRNANTPTHLAQRGESGSAGGQDWRVDSVRRLDTAGPGMEPLPAGTVGFVVTLARTGPALRQGCAGVLTDGRRRWSTVPISVPSRADATTLCEAPGLLELAFEVPAGATPTAVDIVGSDAILLRIIL